MPPLEDWQTHPIAGTPEAAIAGGSAPAQRFEWEGDPVAPPPPAPPEPVPMQLGSGFVPKFLGEQNRALSFGLSDKAGAALTATIAALSSGKPESWSDLYHTHLAQIRGEGETFGQTNPTASNVANIAGTVGSMGTLGPAEGAAAAAATTLGRMWQGAKVGGGIGAASGFGHTNDESLTGDLAATGIGTVIGAGTGATISGLADRVVAPITGWVARRFSPEAAESQAVQAIATRMKKDAAAGGPTAQDMLDLINAAPDKPQALADVAGENVRALAGNVARQPGESREIATRFLNQRDQGAGARLAGDVNQGISAGGSAHDTVDALMQARSAAGQPKWEAVHNLEGVWSPRLQEFLDDPVMRQGLNRGMQLERIESLAERRPFNPTQMGVDLDADGNVLIKDVPNMRVLHSAKMGLDAMIADERNPITGRLSQHGVALNKLRGSYLDELKSLDTSGTYADALSSWSGPSASMDAVRSGQAVFNKRPEEIAAEFGKLQPGDREFYKLGAADALKERLAKTSIGGDEAKKIIGNDYTQSQIRPLFGSDKDFNRFIDATTAENRMFNTRQATIGGSQTAGRLAEDTAPPSEAAGHAMRAAASIAAGEPVGGTLSGLKALGALTRGESPQVNAATARILFNPNSMTDPKIISDLARLYAAQGVGRRLPLSTMPASAAAGAAYPSLTSLPALPFGSQAQPPQ